MKFGTDKVGNGYLPSYLAIAAELGPQASVCEVGVQNGAGLDMFQALFPYGEIVGVDANPDCRWPAGTRAVVAKQDATWLPSRLARRFDLIVDDASHDGVMTAATFANLWPVVNPRGYYVIEDWGVGFNTFRGFNNSMLDMAKGLLYQFEHGNANATVESITYKVGLIIIKKAACIIPPDV